MHSDPERDQKDFRAWQRGDDAVFDRLVSRWERPLFAFAWRYLHHTADAQDVVAETFVRLFRQRNRLRPDTNLSAWLFTTLTNQCHNQARSRRRHPDWHPDASSQDIEALENRPDKAPSAESQVEQDELLRDLKAAVGRLSHPLKTTVLLHYMNGMSYQEIGAITGCSTRGVETRLYRARQMLRKHLAPRLDVPESETIHKPGKQQASHHDVAAVHPRPARH